MNTLAEKLPKSLNLDKAQLEKINQALPPIITVLLIIACSYTLSQITWALLPDDNLKTAPSSQSPSAYSSRQQTQDFSHISDAHLFGVFQQTTTTRIKTDAPETRLNLVLKGVLAATPMEFASAIISIGKNGKEDNYSIGDKISSATVKEIHADRVILQRSGRLETLRMPKDFNDNLIQTAPNSNINTNRPSTPGAVLSDIRKQILQNPTSFGKYAIPVPYNENGKLRGYRLQPQGDRSLFDTVGLNPSDVIIAVNGVELNNPTMGLKALRSLQKAKQINITVLRNGAEVPLQFDVP